MNLKERKSRRENTDNFGSQTRDQEVTDVRDSGKDNRQKLAINTSKGLRIGDLR